MTLPASGPLKLSEVADEFGAPFKVPMTDLVRGGEYVPDVGTGFPNENIPETPPLALTDFYEGDDNPNPTQILDVLLSGAEGEAVGVSSDDVGLIVATYPGTSLPVPPDTQFVMDVRFRCRPNFDAPFVGDVYTPDDGVFPNCYLSADIQLGLCFVNPDLASFSNVLSSFIGARLRFYYCPTSFEGVVTVSGATGSGYLVGTGYNAARPDAVDYGNVRVSRGSTVESYNGWKVLWKIEVFYDNFSSVWEFTESVKEQGDALNVGGYLTVLNNIPTGDGHIDFEFDYLRGYIGSDVPPW